jgi:hypothetical protein
MQFFEKPKRMPLPKGGKRQRHEGKKHFGGLYEKAYYRNSVLALH